MVSPWGMRMMSGEADFVKEDGLPQGDLAGSFGVALGDDVPWGLVFFTGVLAGDIEPPVVDGGFVQEVNAAVEGFDLVELILDQAVDGFDVGLPAMGARRNEVVGTSGVVVDGAGEVAVVAGVPATDELRSVVGLPAARVQPGSPVGQMSQQHLGEEGGAVDGPFLGVGDEHQAAGDIPGRVLDQRQMEAADLGVQLGDIVEVFGVQIDLLKKPPLGFDRPQTAFRGVLPAFALEQSFLMPDAPDGFFGDGDLKVASETVGPPRGELDFEVDDPLALRGGGAAMRMFGGAAEIVQARQGSGTTTIPPLAHSLGGGVEGPRRRFDPVFMGETHHGVAQLPSVFTLAHGGVVWDGTHGSSGLARFGHHQEKIRWSRVSTVLRGGLLANHIGAAIPASPSAPSGQKSSDHSRGDDVPSVFQLRGRFQLKCRAVRHFLVPHNGPDERGRLM